MQYVTCSGGGVWTWIAAPGAWCGVAAVAPSAGLTSRGGSRGPRVEGVPENEGGLRRKGIGVFPPLQNQSKDDMRGLCRTEADGSTPTPLTTGASRVSLSFLSFLSEGPGVVILARSRLCLFPLHEAGSGPRMPPMGGATKQGVGVPECQVRKFQNRKLWFRVCGCCAR